MDTKSQQLMMDLWLDQEVGPLVPKICELINQKFTVLHRTNYQFSPQGETIVFILSESHFALHTYPEVNYLSLDIYVCNLSIDLEAIKQAIIKICQPIKVDDKIIHRGHGTGIK
jgi:S-adenosylmethionine/arginine decarboxylase-like enzyme